MSIENLSPDSELCLKRTPPLLREYEKDVKAQPSEVSPFEPSRDMIKQIEHQFNVKFKDDFDTCTIGGYGAVAIVKDRHTKTKYAVKVVHAKYWDDDYRNNIWYPRASREAYFNKQFSDHPNVGKLLDCLVYKYDDIIPR